MSFILLLLLGVNVIDGVKVAVDPDMTSMAIISDDPAVSILAVASLMEKFGWVIERQQLPETIHVAFELFSTCFLFLIRICRDL